MQQSSHAFLVMAPCRWPVQHHLLLSILVFCRDDGAKATNADGGGTAKATDADALLGCNMSAALSASSVASVEAAFSASSAVLVEVALSVSSATLVEVTCGKRYPKSPENEWQAAEARKISGGCMTANV
ncbi:hypothetical protein V6N12_052731 [Hibiscus sabdariffa]|uniref:Secreted protein n=1 Tax=Hibiscus sabdariffa TaxID=183260 RepID=A0ABR2C2E6_9ROSI